jgi:hypothetical protein
MFTADLGATKSYRTLARGSGSRWARTYRVSRHDGVDQDRSFGTPLGAHGSQRDGRGADVPILSPRGNES